jgi:hypothetical protein
MPFPTVISAPNLNIIRNRQYSATPYVLLNPNDIVFAAQVNQVVFDSTFAEVEFNNVTDGVITDVLDGFTVYIWDTSATVPQFKREAIFIGRARGNQSAGTTLKINESSAALVDDLYITVVKDVAIREKLGNYINRIMKVDWNISYRELPVRITGLKSAYADVLFGGVADFTFPAVGSVTNVGQSVSSWLWNADGGSFINGTVATDAQPDIRYNAAGVYWPRVVVTDNWANEWWFTMPVFVISPDFSDSFVVTGIDQMVINADYKNGYDLRFSVFSDEMVNTPDGNFCAVLNIDDYAGVSTPILDDIAFVGRAFRDIPAHTVDPQNARLTQSPFTIHGILPQIGRLRSPDIALRWNDSPDEFGEIEDMTQWRAATFLLGEFSTVLNRCSLTFDVEDNTYQNKEDSTSKESLLDATNKLLAGRLAWLNQAAAGELHGARNANFLSIADRNALDVIAVLSDNDTFSANIEHEQQLAAGQITGFAGGYNTSDDTLRVLRATAPAVASLDAQNIAAPINNILLDSDKNLTQQKGEIEQITADALADKNLRDLPRLNILDGFWFLSPTNFQWYRYQPGSEDTNRGIDYTADRFLMMRKTMRFDNQLPTWLMSVNLAMETRGVSAKTISQVEPGAQTVAVPFVPGLSAYPSFPSLPSLWQVPGGTAEDELPIKPGDLDAVQTPIEPGLGTDKGGGNQTTQSLQGNDVAWWNASVVKRATNFCETSNPAWKEIFTATSGYSIKDFKFDPFSKRAYVLENDGAGNNNFWNTPDVTQSIVDWTTSATDLNDGVDYDVIRTTATKNRIMIFATSDLGIGGGANFSIDLLNGNGQGDLTGSERPATHASPVSNGVAVYDSGNDRFNSIFPGSGLGAAGNTEFLSPPGVTWTKIQCLYKSAKGLNPSGESVHQIRLDTTNLDTNNIPGGGGEKDVAMSSGIISQIGAVIVFHGSANGATAPYARLFSVHLEGDNNVNQTLFRRSTNAGASFSGGYVAGAEITAGAVPGYDTSAASNETYLPADDNIVEYAGTTKSGNKPGGDSAGTYAKAIWSYGTNAQQDTVFATNAAFGGDTLFKTVNDVQQAITPSFGGFDGIVLGRDSMCMSRVSDEHIWYLADHNGTPKLSYTDDGGSNWTQSAQAFTTDAIYMRVKDTGVKQVYIAQNATIFYSDDGGVTFVEKTPPATGGIGIEVR